MKQLRIDGLQRPRRQTGVALLAMFTLLTLFGLAVFVGQLSATQFRTARALEAADTLAQSREVLIADAISEPSISEAGYLRLPDLGVNVDGVAVEGNASANFAGNGKDRSVIGKLPLKTLDTGVLRDVVGECLWYVVSGRFQTGIVTDALNWDTQGQIDVIDGSGALVASNLAALVVAPGRALDSQDRTLADAAYSQCTGNYDARNYLDTFDDTNAVSDGVSGQVNYFVGSTNNRVAPNSNNKRFVMADTEYYNDRFLFISVADIFDPLIRRRDFSAAITALLDDPAFQTITISGIKGTDAFTCPSLPVKNFCKNWKEMLFLTQLPAPAPITIDGVVSANCRRVLIFAGRRGTGQSRNNDTQRNDTNNYLETPNLASFAVPIAAATNFSGVSVFDYRTPANDILRCLP